MKTKKQKAIKKVNKKIAKRKKAIKRTVKKLTNLHIKVCKCKGNLLAIVGTVKKRLKESGNDDLIKKFEKELKKADYDESFIVIEKYVTLI